MPNSLLYIRITLIILCFLGLLQVNEHLSEFKEEHAHYGTFHGTKR